jgi:hypothetical protein
MNGQAGFAIDAVAGLDHVVLDVAAYSVLRTKQRCQLNVSMLVQQVGGVTKSVIDRRLITNQPNALILESAIPLFK